MYCANLPTNNILINTPHFVKFRGIQFERIFIKFNEFIDFVLSISIYFLFKSKFTRSISPFYPLYLYPIRALMRDDKITKRRRRQPRPTISNVTCLRAFPGLRVTASHYFSSPLVIISK